MTDYLQEAINAIKSGDKATGKRLLIDEVLKFEFRLTAKDSAQPSLR